jgi:basic amino acid/polyamine antiporter, APA family
MPQEPQSHSTSLVRRLSLTDSVLVLAGGIIGSGIFLTAKDIAQSVLHPALFISIWVAGLLITMLACFALAELGAMFPHAGGQYLYLREAYGEFVAFLYGWMIFTVSVSGTIAALGAGFAQYLGSAFPAFAADQPVIHLGSWTLLRGHIVSIAAIVVLTIFNIFGVRCGAVLQNIATWTKFAAIGAFVILGIAIGHGSWVHYTASIAPQVGATSLISGIGVALIAVFWAYDGWVYITWVAGEVKDPQRNIPKALVCGISLVGAIYIAINAVYLYALPMSGIASETTVAQAAAVVLFSASTARWLSLTIAISCFGAMAVAILTGARVYYAMAADGIFFKALARVHPRWRTPAFSLGLQAIWSSLLALSGRYDQLFTYVMLMMVLSYFLTVVAVFVLRRKLPERERPYRCVGYPWGPALYLVIAGIWGLNAVLQRPRETLAGVGIVLIGIPFYLYWRSQKVKEGHGLVSSASSATQIASADHTR